MHNNNEILNKEVVCVYRKRTETMKNFKKIAVVVISACLLLCCVSCVRVDVGLDINKKGTASMSTKMMLDEDLYNMLISFGEEDTENEVPEGEDSKETTDSEAEFEDLDLSKFVKEEINSKTYYSYNVENYNFATYTEAVEKLMELELTDNMSLFKAIEIVNEKETKYKFKATTMAINTEDIASDESMSLPDDWCVLTLTVKMPGEITETNGIKLEDGSVRFEIKDFSEEKEYYIYAEDTAFNPFIICVWVIGGLAIVFCLYKIFTSGKKTEESNTEKINTEEN